MKGNILKIKLAPGLCTLLLFLGGVGLSQVPTVQENLDVLRASSSPKGFDLFVKAPLPDSRDPRYSYLRDFERVKVSAVVQNELLNKRPDFIELGVPGSGDVILELYHTDLFAPAYRLRSSEEGVVDGNENMLFYHGKVVGAEKSMAAVSVFDDEVRVMYAYDEGTYRIHPSNGDYIHFKDENLNDDNTYECFTSDSGIQVRTKAKNSSASRMTGNCVEIYFECDHQSYIDNSSSLTETEQWVTSLFNEVSLFYEDEGIPVSISEIMVWTSTDPYADLTSTGQMLTEFVDQVTTNGYNGRLAHLLSTRGVGGGIAYVDVLCSTTVPCAVSGSLSTTVTAVPNYSWNVNVVTHELGHNFGSPHTHACVWNGDNTQIDDCGNEWATNPSSECYDPDNPILPDNGGTIMSYCHLLSGIGINFDNGFGEQPGNLIYNSYIEASCSTGECFAPVCTNMTEPSPGATDVETSTVITWETVPGADGYKINIGTAPGDSTIANNIDLGNVTEYDPDGLPFGSDIYVTIVPYNQLGDASDCSEQSFTTEADVQPSCTQLYSPVDGATEVNIDADLFWTHSVGNQSGYKLDMGYSPGSTEILNGFDVGNVDTYDPGLLPAETTLYVKVIPYGNGGDEAGCTITSFSTASYGNDLCAGAEAISCGTTVSGNTLDATDDDVSTCGTGITAPGVWYTFVGDGSNVTLSMCGAADYDTKLNVYRGSCESLICVAGNDDKAGCNYASEVAITTIPDEVYLVLVQGWNGNTGNFNLTMACADPPYCPSQGILADDEWISEFSLGPVTHASGQSNYSDFREIIIDVAPGSSYPVSITPDFPGAPFEEYFAVWADFNMNGQFTDEGEELFIAGPSAVTVSGEVTIPTGLADGMYLLRVGMKFETGPTACEVFTYGEVEEYTIRIGGPPGGGDCELVASNTNDTGDGSLRDIIACASSGDTISFAQNMQNKTIVLTSEPLNITKNLTIIASGQNVKVSADAATRVFEVSGGVTLNLVDIELISGTELVGSAIQNYGSLELKNITIKQHTGTSGAMLVDNMGQISVLGSCHFMNP